MIQVVGQASGFIFGITSAERLRRQGAKVDAHIVAHASAVLDDNSINWLVEHRGTALATPGGRPLAVAVEAEPKSGARLGTPKELNGFPKISAGATNARFVRKLRRRAVPLAISLEETLEAEAEWLLYKSVYKGVTDAVTKWIWPLPAFYVTKVAARLGIHPNVITFLGLLLTVLAGWLFYMGLISAGLVAAWLMTFLDTVDGKLARVTVTSSRVGNWLDHGIDVVHPPLWWLCLAHGLIVIDPSSSSIIWESCAILLAGYVVGRLVEVSFHLLFGFNEYLLSHGDAVFRLVVARRNVLLVLMTLGMLAQEPTAAFVACAIWTAACSIIQSVRLAQAFVKARRGRLKPYLM